MPRTRLFVRAVIAFENDLVVGETVVAELVFALDACVEKECWHLDFHGSLKLRCVWRCWREASSTSIRDVWPLSRDTTSRIGAST